MKIKNIDKNFFIKSIILIFFLFVTIYYLRTHINTDLDSDNSSELVLGRLLADENRILTENWYYSTELRVINTNIIYSLMFKLTDKWYRVRLFSNICMFLVLLTAYYGMCCAYNIKKYFPLSASLLFIPFSTEYYLYVLKGAYYIPHILYAILILTFSELFLKTSGKKQYCWAVLSFIISFLSGLGGPRQMLNLFLPMLAAALIIIFGRMRNRESKKFLLFSFAVFTGNGIGYIVNSKILAQKYHFMQWEYVEFTDFSVSQFVKVVTSFLSSFGYETGPISFLSLLRNFVCMAWVLMTIIAVAYGIKNRQYVSSQFVRLAFITVMMFTVHSVFYCFTNAFLRNRFSLPVIFVTFPLIALYFEQVNWNKWISELIFTSMVLLTGLSGLYFYYSHYNEDPLLELRRISKDLVDLGYYNGYASFWNANILTELSNGRIEVWSVWEKPQDLENMDEINQPLPWLQFVSHDVMHPEGKTFLLFNKDEIDYHNDWKDKLTEDDIIVHSNNYVIYGFSDYESLRIDLFPDS